MFLDGGHGRLRLWTLVALLLLLVFVVAEPQLLISLPYNLTNQTGNSSSAPSVVSIPAENPTDISNSSETTETAPSVPENGSSEDAENTTLEPIEHAIVINETNADDMAEVSPGTNDTLTADSGEFTILSTPGPIGSCQILNVAGTYTLNKSISGISSDYCFRITVSGVTLDGNSFSISGREGGYGVRATSVADITIENFGGIDDFNYGVYLSYVDNSSILNNHIDSNADGVHAEMVFNITIDGNSLADNTDDGLDIYSSSNNTMTDNSISYSSDNAIYLHSAGTPASEWNWISRNTITHTTEEGILATDELNSTFYDNTVYYSSLDGFKCIRCNTITLSENNMLYNSQYGIHLSDSDNLTLIGNTASGNTFHGIYLSQSGNNTLRDNQVNLNIRSGVYMTAMSKSNLLDSNIVRRNYQDGLHMDSSSTGNEVNFNNLCGNGDENPAYYDIRDDDSNSGDNNTCDSTDNWHDSEDIGCTNDCSLLCYSVIDVDLCEAPGDCECINSAMADPVCSRIVLNSSVTDRTTTCINNPAGFSGKTLDCAGHTLDGADVPNSFGIYATSKDSLTITNCTLSDWNYGVFLLETTDAVFSYDSITSSKKSGIFLHSSSAIDIYNSSISSNGETGIALVASSNITIQNSTIKQNDNGIDILSGSNASIHDNNITLNGADGIYIEDTANGPNISNNWICSNKQGGGTYYDIHNLDSGNGSNNTCQYTLNWRDSSVSSGCESQCVYVVPCYTNVSTDCTARNTCACISEALSSDTCRRVFVSSHTWSTGVCINNPTGISNKILDCRRNTLNGLDNPNSKAIYLNLKSNITIQNCRLINWGEAIRLSSVTGANIINSSANSGYVGFKVASSTGVHFVNDNATENREEGFYLDHTSSSSITESNGSLNDYGFRLVSSNNNVLENITAMDNYENGVEIYDSSNNQIVNGTVTGSRRNGVYFSSSSSNNTMVSTYACFNNADNNTYYDIDDDDSNSGGNNTCDRADNWADEDQVRCTYACSEHCYVVLGGGICEVSNNCSCISEAIADNVNCFSKVRLLENVRSNGSCINASDFSYTTLDCNGYNLTGNGEGYAVNATSGLDAIVANCTIQNFTRGISFASANESRIYNNTFRSFVSGNGSAIYFGNSSYGNSIQQNTINWNATGNSYAIYYGAGGSSGVETSITANSIRINATGDAFGVRISNEGSLSYNLSDNDFEITSSSSVWGISLEDESTLGSNIIYNNTLDLSADSNVSGISIASSGLAGYSNVSGNHITVPYSSSSGGYCGINITDTGGPSEYYVSSNDISLNSGQNTYGVYVFSNASISNGTIFGNTIYSASASSANGISLAGNATAFLVIGNSLDVSSSATGLGVIRSSGIFLSSGAANNNLSYNDISAFARYATSIDLYLDSADLNRFRNNTCTDATYSVYIASGTGNVFYDNNFNAGDGEYAAALSTGNNFSIDVGGYQHGNFWPDTLSLIIYDNTGDGYGETGAQYPYNRTNGALVSDNVVDWGPITNKSSGAYCGEIIKYDTNLTADLNCPSTAFYIGADDITLDCMDHTINGSFVGYGFNVTGRNNVVIKNCRITRFTRAINLDGTRMSLLDNNTMYNNSGAYSGIYLQDSERNVITSNLFTSNNASGNAGVFLYGSQLNTIQDAIFSNNVISAGTVIGGILGLYLSSDDNTLRSISLAGNSITATTINGGGLFGVRSCTGNIVEDLQVYNNSVTATTIYGGAIGLRSSVLNELTSVLANNNSITAITVHGGGLLGVYSSPQNEFTSLQLNSSETVASTCNGGGIVGFVQSNSNSLTSSHIEASSSNCSSVYGGGIVGAYQSSSNTFSSVNLSLNSEKSNNVYGGGLFGFHSSNSNNATQLRIYNNTVLSNISGGGALGIYSSSSNIFIQALLTNNTISATNVSGGGILGLSNSAASNSFSAATLENNNISATSIYGSSGLGLRSSSSNTFIGTSITEGGLPDGKCVGLYDTTATAFRNGNTSACNYSVYITSGTGNRFYWNNFSAGTPLYAVSLVSGNHFNTTVSGVPQGNLWGDIYPLNIYDTDYDGYADAGSQYPYKADNGANVSDNVIDWGPITTRARLLLYWDWFDINSTTPYSLTEIGINASKDVNCMLYVGDGSSTTTYTNATTERHVSWNVTGVHGTNYTVNATCWDEFSNTVNLSNSWWKVNESAPLIIWTWEHVNDSSYKSGEANITLTTDQSASCSLLLDGLNRTMNSSAVTPNLYQHWYYTSSISAGNHSMLAVCTNPLDLTSNSSAWVNVNLSVDIRTKPRKKNVIEYVDVPKPLPNILELLKRVSMAISYPRQVRIEEPGTRLLNISVTNDGEMDLTGISIDLVTNTTASNVSLSTKYLGDLAVNQTKGFSLILTNPKLSQPYPSTYKVVLMATSSDPALTEEAVIVVVLYPYLESDRLDAQSKAAFVDELLHKNPQCLDLIENMEYASQRLEAGDYEGANKMLDEITDACRRTISEAKTVRVTAPAAVATSVDPTPYFIAGLVSTIAGLLAVIKAGERMRRSKSRW